MKKILLITLLLSFATQYPMDVLRKKFANVKHAISSKVTQRINSKKRKPSLIVENPFRGTDAYNTLETEEETLQQALDDLSEKELAIDHPVTFKLNKDKSTRSYLYSQNVTFNPYDFFYTNKKVYKFVAGHELAHIERHNINRLRLGITIPCYMYLALKTYYSKTILQNCKCLSAWLVFLLIDNYQSRKEEKICDMRALELCQTNEGALIDFSERKKYQKDKDKIWKNIKRIFASHPELDERYQYCSQWKPEKK